MAGEVRQKINIASLERYIDANVPEIKTPIGLKQFGYGQSNPTYQLTDATGKRFVVRKKPPGKILNRAAHQVEREYKVIHALRDTDVPAPRVYGLCEDNSVIGTPFYIMSFLDGRIFDDPTIPGVTPRERLLMWKSAIESLAKLHKVPYADEKIGLKAFGKSSGFYSRQIRTWLGISASQAPAKDADTGEPVGEIPRLEEMADYFRNNLPKDRSSIVHGDYKIDNVVYHPTEPYVIGILDWELATIGHPLSDICNILNPFVLLDSPFKKGLAFGDSLAEGMPTREQAIAWYAEEAGWNPLPDMDFGDAFVIFRTTVVTQGIMARYATRQASSIKAKDHGMQRFWMAEKTLKMIEAARSKKSEKSKI